MRILSYTFLLSLVSLLFVSCQKEVRLQFDNGNTGTVNGGGGSGGNKSIVGDYTFLGVKSEGTSSVDVLVSGISQKSLTTFAYTSFANQGTVKITSSKITFSKVGYEIDTVMNSKIYTAGSLVMNMDVPFTFSYPASSPDVSSDYIQNRTDSITILGEAFIANPNAGSAGGAQQQVGTKIVWSSDTLRLYMRNKVNSPVSQNGGTGTLTGDVKGILILKKK